jgi:micrococcal nuclease
VRTIATRLVIALLALAAVAGASGVLDGGEPDGGSRREATVARVVDGDTVVLSGVGKSRLIGIDTPEVFGTAECFGREASAFAKRLLAGRRVRYAAGAEPRDRYGRALVYLWLADGRFVNELLVSRGFARTLAIAPNVRYAARLRRRAREARGAERGLWSPRACG